MKIDYDAIRAEYLAGHVSIRVLAEKHGIPEAGLAKRAARARWRDARRAVSYGVQRAAEREAVETKGETLSELNAACLALAKGIRMRVLTKLEAAAATSTDITPADLRQLAAAAETAQRIGRLALGAPTTARIVTDGPAIDLDGDPLERIRRRMAALYQDGGPTLQ